MLVKKKTETPVSIMSKLLKEHLIAIEKEIGEFPSEIAFSLLDDFFDTEALEGKNRIEKELMKVCELRNLEYSFVDPNFVPLFKQ
uniref:Uncharacterized protein n=1 Tax=Panagrolaimus sp. PS1159 TaxID=55785 RepID=A0AC35GND2_9BILA